MKEIINQYILNNLLNTRRQIKPPQETKRRKGAWLSGCVTYVGNCQTLIAKKKTEQWF